MDTTPLFIALGAAATISAATTGHTQTAVITGALTATALGIYIASVVIKRAAP